MQLDYNLECYNFSMDILLFLCGVFLNKNNLFCSTVCETRIYKCKNIFHLYKISDIIYENLQNPINWLLNGYKKYPLVLFWWNICTLCGTFPF